MDDVTAFERQVADEIFRIVGPARRVDDLAVYKAVTATRSPRWRFPSMFGAMKYIVAGVVVALFGGFLMSGVLTTRPDEDSSPIAGASASATASASPAPEPTATAEQATPSPPSSPPDPVLGVDVATEQVAPGVFVVKGDGGTDRVLDGVHGVVVASDGGVWVQRGHKGDWDVERLGEPGVSRHFSRKQLALERSDDGSPLVTGSHQRALVYRDGAWVETDAKSEIDAKRGGCEAEIMGDGTCWSRGGKGAGWLEYWDDGDWQILPNADIGLGDQEWIGSLAAGPDGSGWASVKSYPETGPTFGGLLRYEAGTWSRIPYPEDARDMAGSPTDLEITPDGSVWVVGLGSTGSWLRRWDGQSWASFGPGEAGGPLLYSPAYPRADGSIVFLRSGLLFDGESLHPLDLPEGPLIILPDMFVWTGTADGRLYVIDPQALVAAD